MSQASWIEKDFYGALGVEVTVDPAGLKSAYRTMARKHHPDLNAGDSSSEERFKQILEAYSVLSDQMQRSTYDRVRAGSFSGGSRRESGFARYRNMAPMVQPVTGPPRRGNDLEQELVVSAKDARRGRLVQMQLHDRGRPTRTAVLFIRGVSDGERVFFKGKGGFGENGGDVGDLYVTVRVRQPQTTDRNQSGAAGTYGDEPMDLPGVTKLLKEWTF
jgi:molecular chaperone DnaJ